MLWDMDLVSKYGRMEVDMKVNGSIIKWTVTVNSSIRMVTIMKVNGKMIYSIQRENIPVKMDIYTKVNGTMVKSREKVFKAGKMDKFMLDNLKRALSMAKELWNLKMEAIMKVSLPLMR